MNAIDFSFLLARLFSAVIFVPVALAIQVAALMLLARFLGIGTGGGRRGLRQLFDTIETSPQAVATFLGAVVIAAALISAALVR
jgi:hypothetical protein